MQWRRAPLGAGAGSYGAIKRGPAPPQSVTPALRAAAKAAPGTATATAEAETAKAAAEAETAKAAAAATTEAVAGGAPYG